MFEHCVFLPYTQLEAQKKCVRAARKMRPLDMLLGAWLDSFKWAFDLSDGQNWGKIVGWRTAVLNNCYRRLAVSIMHGFRCFFEFR